MIPQTQSGSSSSHSTSLSTSNSRLTLTLPPPPHPSESYLPGDTLHPQLKINTSASEYTTLSLKLRGETRANIMGHERWQVAQQTNLGMGGNAMMITSLETWPFLDIDIPLISKDAEGASRDAKGGEKKKGSNGKEEAAGSGVYEVTIPDVGDKGLLPTFRKLIEDMAGVEVRYYLELLGTRKGMFKSNDKLSIDIPFAIIAPPISHHVLQDPSQWPSKSISKELKFKSSESSQSELGVDVTISYKPITTTSSLTPTSLSFLLSLSSSSSTSSILKSYPIPSINSSLSRKARTTPIVQPENGRDFTWAGITTGPPGKIEEVQVDEGQVWKWKGEIGVPKGQRTVDCPALSVSFTLQCSITSPAFASSLVISIPVFVPSSNIEPGEREGCSDAYGVGEGEGLPVYKA